MAHALQTQQKIDCLDYRLFLATNTVQSERETVCPTLCLTVKS